MIQSIFKYYWHDSETSGVTKASIYQKQIQINDRQMYLLKE